MQPELDTTNKLTIGLALGGGGMRALAHIGVLKVLEQEGVRFDFVAGTSMGGIVAAAYAKGMSVAEMEAEAKRLASLGNVLKLVDWAPGFRSIMQGQNISNYLGELLGERLSFDELAVPLVLTAVDLNSWREIVLSSGNVIDAIRATSAIPGVIAPFEHDGKRLVDGGFLNNVPADLARQLGADIVIAVDVGIGVSYGAEDIPKKAETSPLPNFIPSIALDLWQINAIMIKALTEHKLHHAAPEVLLLPKVPTTVGMLSGWSQIDKVIQAGYDAAMAALPHIRSVVPEAQLHANRPPQTEDAENPGDSSAPVDTSARDLASTDAQTAYESTQEGARRRSLFRQRKSN